MQSIRVETCISICKNHYLIHHFSLLGYREYHCPTRFYLPWNAYKETCFSTKIRILNYINQPILHIMSDPAAIPSACLQRDSRLVFKYTESQMLVWIFPADDKKKMGYYLLFCNFRTRNIDKCMHIEKRWRKERCKKNYALWKKIDLE